MFIPIDRCAAYRSRISFRETLCYSDGTSEKPEAEVIIVELASGEVSGFGEFYATSLNYPEGSDGRSDLDEWDEILEACGALLGKDAVSLRQLIPERYNGLENASGIVDCLDFALHDLVGKARQIPAWALIGGRRRVTVPAMPVIHTDAVPAMVAKALDWQARWGIRLFKLKPHADFDQDVKMMRAFADALKPGTRFTFDAGFAYKSLEEAIQTHVAVAPMGVFIAEDPFRADYDTYRDVLRPRLNEKGVQLMLDEQARRITDIFDIVGSRCADIVNFHANWHSGFTGALNRCAVCEAGGMKTLMGSSVYAGIADAANILLASVFPNLVVCEQVRGADFYLKNGSVVDQFYPLVDGEYRIPDLPGLGIEVNRTSLQRYAIECCEIR